MFMPFSVSASLAIRLQKRSRRVQALLCGDRIQSPTALSSPRTTRIVLRVSSLRTLTVMVSKSRIQAAVLLQRIFIHNQRQLHTKKTMKYRSASPRPAPHSLLPHPGRRAEIKRTGNSAQRGNWAIPHAILSCFSLVLRISRREGERGVVVQKQVYSVQN